MNISSLLNDSAQRTDRLFIKTQPRFISSICIDENAPKTFSFAAGNFHTKHT